MDRHRLLVEELGDGQLADLAGLGLDVLDLEAGRAGHLGLDAVARQHRRAVLAREVADEGVDVAAVGVVNLGVGGPAAHVAELELALVGQLDEPPELGQAVPAAGGVGVGLGLELGDDGVGDEHRRVGEGPVGEALGDAAVDHRARVRHQLHVSGVAPAVHKGVQAPTRGLLAAPGGAAGMPIADLARELVTIPSHDDPAAAGDAIEDWLRAETDAAVTRDGAGNVIARKGSGPSLALVGHHDVVPPDESQVEGDAYAAYEADGRLHGRGSADMKGAVAAAMRAFRDAEPAGELVFASFVGEEVGGTGCRAAIEDGFAPDYAVVGEGSTDYSGPGVTDVVVAHKGRRASTVTARGEATHASLPEEGVNAVYRACEAVDVIRELEFPEVEVLGEAVRGSVAVTEIHGGEAWNVIPDECAVTVDERTVPGERADLGRVEAIEGVEWAVDQDLPPMACDDDAFAAAVLEAAAAAAAGEPELVSKPHATDAGWLAEAGVTCVICGPAERGEAHTATESVGLDVLERCEAIYRDVAEAWPPG